MKLLSIVQHTGITAACYDPSYRRPIDWLQKRDPYSNLYLILLKSDEINHTIIDFNQLMGREAGFHHITSWDYLISQLTNDIIDKYKAHSIAVPHMMRKGDTLVQSPTYTWSQVAPRIVSCGHDTALKTHYGTHTYRGDDDVYPLRWRASDFMVDIPEDHAIDINATLPIVNGISFFPTVEGRRLYANGAAYFCRNRQDVDRGHLLVDFSPFGGAEFISMKECRGSFSNLILPAGKSAAGKFVIMVVNGRWYFPGEFVQLSDRSFSFDYAKYPCELHYLDDKLTQYQFTFNTMELMDEAFNQRNVISADRNFFILIADGQLKINRTDPLMRIASERLKFPLYAGGLLMEKGTRTFVDYSRVRYTDHQIFWLPYLNRFESPIKDHADNLMQSHGQTNNAWHYTFDKVNHNMDPSYVLLDLVGVDPDLTAEKVL